MGSTQHAIHKFTAHDYHRISAPKPPSEILRDGRRAIEQATNTAQWRSVLFTPNAVSTRNACVYEREDSVVPAPRAAPIDVPEPGSTLIASEDERAELSNLQPFASTDLTHLTLSTGKRHLHIRSTLHGNESHASARDRGVVETPPPIADRGAKRRRVDDSMLHSSIPQPHFLPSPCIEFQTLDTSRVPPYKKAHPMPIPPHDPSTMQAYLTNQHARCAWIVPVCGVLPWAETSSASVLEDKPDGSVLPSPPSCIGGKLTWTRPALASFWAFLLGVRDAGTLGPIALSFYAPPPPSAHPVAAGTVQEREQSPVDSIFGSDLNEGATRMPLVKVCHVKIYHDVGYAMSLRNVLDAWSFVEHAMEGRTKETTKLVKIRLLKGARFVLLNDASEGVLTS